MESTFGLESMPAISWLMPARQISGCSCRGWRKGFSGSSCKCDCSNCSPVSFGMKMLTETRWLQQSAMVFVEMINNRAKLFCLSVERPEEIDIRRAQEAKERAEEQLRQKQSIQEYHMNQLALARAMTRLRVTKNL